MSIATEAEAKTRWCPMARLPADHVGGGINRDTTGRTHRASCVGAACMMWRWRDAEAKDLAPVIVFPEEMESVPLFGGEPVRPPEVVSDDFRWIPFVEGESEEGEDDEGGFWVESPEAVARRVAAQRAQRRGFCGLAGPVGAHPHSSQERN